MSNGHKQLGKAAGYAMKYADKVSEGTFREDAPAQKFVSHMGLSGAAARKQLETNRAASIAARSGKSTTTPPASTTPVVARTGTPKVKSAMSKAITGRSEGRRTYNIKGRPTMLSSSEQRLGGYSSTMGRPVSEADYTPRHQGGNLNIGYAKGGGYTVKGGWKPKKKNR